MLVGPVKNNPAFLKSSKPAYCCQINATPNRNVINKNTMGPITKKIRETILSIQNEEIKDTHNWLKHI